MVVRSKRRVLSKKKGSYKSSRKAVIRRPKRARVSKISILEKSGLIGCLTGTGVTSKNYKDVLYKK